MSDYQSDWFTNDDGDMDFGTDGMVDEEEEEKEEEEGEVDKQKMAAEDLQFPDEMQTPSDESARRRFVKYRSLQSFRSSPWHPKENLPTDYAKVFQFENFSGLQRKLVDQRGPADDSECTSYLAEPNQLVEIVLKDCVDQIWHRFQDTKLLILTSLLPHENKLSVLHFSLQRQNNNGVVIQSKDPLLFQVGFRRFPARPIFSELNLNCDKHKFDRFLQHDCKGFSMATAFGPVTFSATPLPVLVFKKSVDGILHLVASGTFITVDPDKIILKKVLIFCSSNFLLLLSRLF